MQTVTITYQCAVCSKESRSEAHDVVAIQPRLPPGWVELTDHMAALFEGDRYISYGLCVTHFCSRKCLMDRLQDAAR